MPIQDKVLEWKKEAYLKIKMISQSRNQGLLGCDHRHQMNKKHQSQVAAAKKTTKVVCKMISINTVIYPLNWSSRGK